MGRDAVCAGRRFGHLTCVEPDDEGEWRCRCDCGGEICVDEAMLLSGVITSCGCKKSRCINLKGERFGRLVAESPLTKRDVDNSVRWLCRCDCGKEIDVSYNRLVYGNMRSCGCQKKEHDQALQGYLAFSAVNASTER